MIFTATVIFFFIVLLVSFFFYIILNYFRANSKRQHELLNAIIQTQENERVRIARDLHDELGPTIAAVKLQVGAMKNYLQGSSEEVLTQTKETLNDAVIKIRQIVNDLVPKNIEQNGISGVLIDLKQSIENYSEVRVNLSISNSDQRYAHQSEINLYRIIHEIVGNALRHSEAKNISVSLTDLDETVTMAIKDDGGGFDSAQPAKGHGLKNILTRVEMSKGTCELKTSPGNGTSYLIVFEKKNLL